MNFDLLRPRRVYGSILDISLPELSRMGIRGIIIDIDNTLTEWHSPILPEGAVAWLEWAGQLQDGDGDHGHGSRTDGSDR